MNLNSTLRLVMFATRHSPLFGQSTFQNLNFESALVPVIPAGEYGADQPVNRAFPGWTVELGPYVQTTVKHNNVNLGTAYVELLGPEDWSGFLEGRYACILVPGSDPVLGPGQIVSASIAQTGVIPSDAQSFLFKGIVDSGTMPPAKPFAVYLGGEELSLSPLLVTSSYTLYGADVTSFASQQVELRFTSFWPSALFVDAIEFSSDPIPEPSVLLLLVAGGMAAVIARPHLRRHGNRRKLHLP